MTTKKQQSLPKSFREERTYTSFFFQYLPKTTATERNLRNRFDVILEAAKHIQDASMKEQVKEKLHKIKQLIEKEYQHSERSQKFVELQRLVLAWSYGVIQYKKISNSDFKWVVKDFVDQSAEDDKEFNAENKMQQSVIDNNIRLTSLGFFGRCYFRFMRFWHDYHAKPMRNMFIVGVLVSALLYLQSGLLNFTPMSTILLGSMLILSIPLISTFCYVNIRRFMYGQTAKVMNRTEEKKQIEDVTIWNVLKHLFHYNTGGSLLLWTTSLASGIYFLLAVSNHLAYSCFLTSSAISFLPFATTLWGCFACSAVAMLLLYAFNREFVPAADTSSTNTQKSYHILGIKCETRHLGQIVLNHAKSTAETGKDLLFPVAKDALKEIRDGVTPALSNTLEEDPMDDIIFGPLVAAAPRTRLPDVTVLTTT